MTSYDDDTFTLVWNRLTNGNRDYVQFNGGNSNTIGNETVTWSGSGGAYTDLDWVNGDTLFVRVKIAGTTGTVWARNITKNTLSRRSSMEVLMLQSTG